MGNGREIGIDLAPKRLQRFRCTEQLYAAPLGVAGRVQDLQLIDDLEPFDALLELLGQMFISVDLIAEAGFAAPTRRLRDPQQPAAVDLLYIGKVGVPGDVVGCFPTVDLEDVPGLRPRRQTDKVRRSCNP